MLRLVAAAIETLPHRMIAPTNDVVWLLPATEWLRFVREVVFVKATASAVAAAAAIVVVAATASPTSG
jgi:hypothetical protein